MDVKRFVVFRDDETNHPMLKEKEILHWDSDFSTYKRMVDFLNKNFEMDHLEEEYVYIISFNCQFIPQGVFQLSHGTADNALIGMRELAIFLLLSGANKFIAAHNHPNGIKDISEDDFCVTNKMREMANAIGVKFLQHFTIGNDGYDTCIDNGEDDDIFKENDEEDEDYMPFD